MCWIPLSKMLSPQHFPQLDLYHPSYQPKCHLLSFPTYLSYISKAGIFILFIYFLGGLNLLYNSYFWLSTVLSPKSQ